MKKQLIPKHQLGNPIARLSLLTERKTLPNGESVLEWVWDKASNADEYLSQGLDWIIGAVDPTITAEDAVEKGKKDREYRSKPHYELGVTGEGDTVLIATYLPPLLGYPPTPSFAKLPRLPVNASAWAREAYDKAAKARLVAMVRASLLKNSSLKTKQEPKSFVKARETAKLYDEELSYNDYLDEYYASLDELLNATQRVQTDPTKQLSKDSKKFKSLVRKQNKSGQLGRLTGSAKTTKSGDKFQADNKMTHFNTGRPATKLAITYIIDKTRGWSNKSPAIIKAFEKYDKKVAKGINKDALSLAEKELVKTILDNSPGFFTQQRKVLGFIK